MIYGDEVDKQQIIDKIRKAKKLVKEYERKLLIR